MERWVVSAKRADFQGIAQRFSIDPVIARLIRNREIQGDDKIQEYLHGSKKDLPHPGCMKGMKEALAILIQKIHEKKPIRIIGDYDIDGVCSTYILLTGLKRTGACVDTYIPDRVADGYGIHDHLIRKALEDKIDTILTCDNGIAAFHEIAFAKEQGMTVVVTDHHEIPFEDRGGERSYQLPPADAIVNPHQADCPYPNKNVCGAVVAYHLIQLLYEHFHISERELEMLLEFAAIATVGDVMDLQGENRILVKEGLSRLPHTKNLGLQELIRANHLENGKISSYHIGFVIGPCINASGRLDTAARSLALFCAKDREEAARLAGDLVSMNTSRKALTEEGRKKAEELVENTSIANDRVLVIYLPECHESLAGIIAGRIREKYYKPVFVLTRGEQGVKGSGRSIEGYSMYEELVKCKDLMTQFGGHPMAAGLSMEEGKVELFRKRLNENCTLTEKELSPKVVIDVAMPFPYISRKLIQELSLLEPFGKGNEKPVFAQKEIQVLNPRAFGKNRNVVKMQLMDSHGFTIEGIYFGDAEAFLKNVSGRETVSITYYPTINSYMGRDSIQLVVQNYC
ncbi:MAG: single-stranded-DNA-specific exonuclease RecJ [Eubacteriales bacterium]|nr:single-stranded-DNA-specific exonuclease RecJ [Eubacteriales bacterium]